MRFIVAQTDPTRLAGEGCEPLPVGVVRWVGERLTVVVKATYRYDPTVERQRLSLCPTQAPLTLATPTSVADLVAFKPQTDVLLLGHAHAPSARIQIGDVDRVFCVVGGERVALTPEFVRAPDGASPTEPVGPCGPFHDVPGAEGGSPALSPKWDAPPADEYSWDDLADTGDLYRTGGVSFASAEQRSGYLRSAGVIALTNLCEGGGVRLSELPEHTPIVVVETTDADYWVSPYCDTVTIDTDDNVVSLVWRGQVPYRGAADQAVRRIVVSLERDDEELRPIGTVYRELQRGHYFRAVEEPDLLAAAPADEADEAELLLAKYETWGLTPEPMLELETYASVSAQLAGSSDRTEVLRRHDLDEDRWLLEERAWLTRLSDAIGNDDELVTRYEAAMSAMRRGMPSDRRNG